MRSDGLSAVLKPLLDDRRILAATLVDVGSGLILDGYADDPSLADLELLGAGHADLVRASDALGTADDTGPRAELTVDTGDGRHHLLHAVPDPHGDRLVVAVVVRGAARHVERARRRLRQVEVEALTAGPTLQRRPVNGSWEVEPTAPASPDPASPGPASPDPASPDPGEHPETHDAPPARPVSLAPLSAMSPRGPAGPTASHGSPPSWTVSSVAALGEGRAQRSPGRTSPLS
ncbi:hypothetical protein [Actinomycetospora cinnamomea]|uniref:hypothetical protein n=1 Tax=Actinomycetospora cinnamomea TaxID=663609 RepID=UPI000E31560A|nr:hypothetical protein [Actinomycetospora cinnamomea]